MGRVRWGRFSLRALLIMMAAVGVVTALIVRRYDQTRNQAAIVEYLRANDGDYGYSYEFDSNGEFFKPEVKKGIWPGFLVAWLGKDFFYPVEYLAGFSVDLPTDMLARIGELYSLREIQLFSCQLSSEDLAFLRKLKGLRGLDLTCNQIADDGLVHLSKLESLERLDLRFQLDGISDLGIRHLTKLTSLKSIRLRGSNITDDGIGQLAALTHLEEIWLFSTQVSSEGAERLRRQLPNCKISVVKPKTSF